MEIYALDKAERGIIYTAVGDRYVDEAMRSARSAKRCMPDIHITLFTSEGSLPCATPVFDQVVPLPNMNGSCLDKMAPLALTPYARTLFLDTDTYVCEPVYDLYEVLDTFELAIAYAPNRYQFPVPECPDAFMEPNSGVIAYRNSEKVLSVLKEWPTAYETFQRHHGGPARDQHSLRLLLYRSALRVLFLPEEYNFRTIAPGFIGKNAKVKIIHGRAPDLQRVAEILNSGKGWRVVLANPFRLLTSEVRYFRSAHRSVLDWLFHFLPKKIRDFIGRTAPLR